MTKSLENLTTEIMPLTYDEIGHLMGGFTDIDIISSYAKDENNDLCSGNATCVNNGTCSGNSICKVNGICHNNSGRCTNNGNTTIVDDNTGGSGNQNNPCTNNG